MIMKLFKNIILFAVVALFASCETDVDTPQIYTPSQFVAPVIGNCGDVIVNADNSASENVIFTWEPADFGLQVQVLYSVYLTSGEASALLGTSSSTSLTISKGDLNGVVINGLDVAANTTADVSAYVTAELAGTKDYEAIKSNISNKFKVTTFAAELKKLYAVGLFNGWNEKDAVEIWETSGGTNVYEGMLNLLDDGTGLSGFKILTERSWGGEGNWGYDAFTVGDKFTSSSDGNLVLPAGYWKISVNRTAMSIDAVSVTSVDILGTFNDWNEAAGDTPLTYDAVENVWASEPVVFAAGGEFLIRLNANWNNKYGSSGVASSAISGGIELVTGGGGNIAVPDAGTYVIKLHAERNPYVVEMVKQ